jgi:hypothetical protein
MVIKRTKVLRGMVPGGELLDGVSLLCEVMDKYIVHLRAQVTVLRPARHAVLRGIDDVSWPNSIGRCTSAS